MNNNFRKKSSSELIDKLINFFKKLPNSKKKGDLSEMLLRDDFHNKHQTEEDYQKEQKNWLEKIKKEKVDKKL